MYKTAVKACGLVSQVSLGFWALLGTCNNILSPKMVTGLLQAKERESNLGISNGINCDSLG